MLKGWAEPVSGDCPRCGGIMVPALTWAVEAPSHTANTAAAGFEPWPWNCTSPLCGYSEMRPAPIPMSHRGRTTD